MFKAKTKETQLELNQQIGQTLRGARESQGVELLAISDECKLQEKFLRSVEEGHTANLPSHIYFRMFARTYAESLGLDADRLLGRLYMELPSPEYAPSSGPKEYARTIDPDDESLAQALDNGSVGATAPPIDTRPQVTRSLGGYPLRPQVAAGSRTAMELGYALSKHRTLISKVSLGLLIAVLAFVVGRFATLNTGLASDDSQSAGATGTTKANVAQSTEIPGIANYQPRKQLQLTLRALGSTSVVIIADGDTLLDRKLSPGEALTWLSNYRFEINLGNKEKVELFIGGQKLKPLPGSAKSINNFEINQLNFEELLAENGSTLPAPSTPTSPAATK